MTARIYQPAKTAMQSGRAKTRQWVLEFEPAEATRRDPLMGWSSSGDTRQQLSLHFETLDEAVAYAQRNDIAYTVQQPHARTVQPKSYAENFAWKQVR
jgi:hypothetical protein